MISAPMRYKGFTWYHNPKMLEIINGKKTVSLSFPYSHREIEEMFRENTVLKGQGELYGADCISQFNGLERLFSQKGKGVLSIGGMPSFEAYFTALELLCEPKENIVSYSFEFVVVTSKEKNKTSLNYHIAKANETLWDISYIYGVSVQRLAQLNPEYKRPDSVSEGDKVILC